MKFKVNKTKLQKDNKNLNKDTINLKDKINLNEDKINLNEYIINLNTDTIEKKNETLKIILNTNLPSPKKWDTDKIRSFGNNKAILGYLNAYFDHCPIKVSPNIIWQLILNSFSSYVNKNSESLREKFVNFFGKKDLMFIRVGTFKDLYKYEEGIIEELCQQISENIGTDLMDALTPNFSTSTKNTIIAGKVSIMSTFNKYFRFMGSMFNCGIPYILLEGSLEDWEKILKKLEFLSKYGFYTSQMIKNIEEIINTKKGNINYEFWRNIIMETKETVEKFINCSPIYEEKLIIRGWICDFYYGMKRYPERNKLVEEVLKVPVQINQIETGETKEAIIYTGIRDLKQDPESFVVEPIVNYCFSLDNIKGLHFDFDFDFDSD